MPAETSVECEYDGNGPLAPPESPASPSAEAGEDHKSQQSSYKNVHVHPKLENLFKSSEPSTCSDFNYKSAVSNGHSQNKSNQKGQKQVEMEFVFF